MNENSQQVIESEISEESSNKVSVRSKTAPAPGPNLFAAELANIFSGLFVIAIAFLFLFFIRSIFGILPGVRISAYLIMAFIVLGTGAFLGMMYFIERAEKQERFEANESAYLINEWRISTLSSMGLPEDIISGLTYILPDKTKKVENPELVMKQPFETDSWICKLCDLLGEERVIMFKDRLLKHTKTRIRGLSKS